MNKPTTTPNEQPFWQRVFFERLMRVDYSTTPTKAREQLAALCGYIDGLLYADVIGLKKHQELLNLITQSKTDNTSKEDV